MLRVSLCVWFPLITNLWAEDESDQEADNGDDDQEHRLPVPLTEAGELIQQGRMHCGGCSNLLKRNPQSQYVQGITKELFLERRVTMSSWKFFEGWNILCDFLNGLILLR